MLITIYVRAPRLCTAGVRNLPTAGGAARGGRATARRPCRRRSRRPRRRHSGRTRRRPPCTRPARSRRGGGWSP